MSKLTSLLFLPIAALAVACGNPADPTPEAGSDTDEDATDSDPSAGTSTGGDSGEDSDETGATTGEPADPDVPARGGIMVSLVEANPGVAVPIGANGAWVGPEGRNAPLVKGRNTVVRVYVDVDESTWIPRDIEARLSIHLPDGTVEVLDEVTTISTDSSTSSMQSGFLFGVLGEWMVPGVRYQIELFEAGTGWEGLPPVEQAPVIPPQPEYIGVEATELAMKVVLVPVSYSGPSCTRDVDASEETLQRYADAMYQQNPLETLDIRWDPPYVVDDLDLRDGGDFFALLGRAQAYRASQAPDPNTYYYLLFDNCGACVSESGGCLLGVAGGIPNDSQGAAPMRVAIGTQYLGNDEVGVDTFVHELGHTQGRQHVACPGAAAAGPDVTYPYEGGTIGVWGFGVRDFQIRSASSHTDYMSYCSPTWVSDWQWNATYDRIRTLTSWDMADASGSDGQPIPQPVPQPILVGSVDPASGRAQWWTERGGITAPTEGHALRFLAGDTVLEVGDVQIDAWSEGSGYTVRAPLPAGYDDEVTAIEYLAPERAYTASRSQMPSYHRPDDLVTNQ
ncbi:zinc metalloprotease [Paraliomyxa miuraensis]|uniref:hypothetical protein n=1 Tax=Paraliomyxa miuraensis TaxID=376150 RepID=UPI00225AC569|nr:hypothetical protein [Paraliomyxa miuraensis]MCX4239704.1 hypothetical protein [Paraliomyxa miuraensis]